MTRSEPNDDAAAIFDRAVALPPAERAAYLARACSDDDLRAEVVDLLAADAAATPDFLDESARRGLAATVAQGVAAGPGPGDRVGSWRLDRELGRGGMGTVHLAVRDDGDFEQRVAVKLMRPGLDSADLLARFRQERRLLAGLDHPNIARLIDGGLTPDGRSYLVMEHVDGRPIDVHCRECRLDVRARLELVLAVCRAVSHAHRHLVVHRDLKPSNLLVDRQGRCKLLDFGIAKVLDPERDSGVRTVTATRLLSPRYASPEQVAGGPVTTACDVYALGVVLYELLSGTSPYPVPDAPVAGLEEAIRKHRPAPPSHSARQGRNGADAVPVGTIDSDLDAIVLKALRKEPERRYDSVESLATDLRRYLDGHPVEARPDTAAYRLGKFVRRHRSQVTLAAAAVLLLASAAVVSTVQYLRAERQQRTAEHIGAFLGETFRSIDPEVARGADTGLMRGLLDRAAADLAAGRVPDRRAAGQLHATIGNTFASLDAYDQAETHLRRAVELVADPGPVRVDLGRVLFEAGRYDEAEPLLRRVLAAVATNPDKVATAALAHHHLGLVLQATDQDDEAERHLRAASVLRPGRFRFVQDLAAFQMNYRQDHAGVDSLLHVALGLARTDPEAGPLAVPRAQLTLATNDRRRGNDAAAVTRGREALAGFTAILPPGHATLGAAQEELAGILEANGDLAEAERLYRQALATVRRRLGPDHRDVGTLANNLAGLLRRDGRPDEAAPHYAEAVQAYEATLGPDHTWLGIILGGQAANEAARGNWAEAEALTRECLRIRRLHWEPGHWRVAIAENLLGACLAARGELTAAEAMLTTSGRAMVDALGVDHPAVAVADARLAALREIQAGGSPDNLR